MIKVSDQSPRARGSLAVSAGLITAVKIIIKKRLLRGGGSRCVGDRGLGLRVGLAATRAAMPCQRRPRCSSLQAGGAPNSEAPTAVASLWRSVLPAFSFLLCDVCCSVPMARFFAHRMPDWCLKDKTRKDGLPQEIPFPSDPLQHQQWHWATGRRARASPGAEGSDSRQGRNGDSDGTACAYLAERPTTRLCLSSASARPRLQPAIIYETNLLSLINPLLEYIYCSTTLSNHALIRLNRFVSQISLHLCN